GGGGAGGGRWRLHSAGGGVVLRRACRRHRSAPYPGRRGVGRIGRARPGELGQFRRLASATGAVRRAPALCERSASPPHSKIRDGGGGPVGAGAPAAATRRPVGASGL